MGGVVPFGVVAFVQEVTVTPGELLADAELINYTMGASEKDEEEAIREAVDFSVGEHVLVLRHRIDVQAGLAGVGARAVWRRRPGCRDVAAWGWCELGSAATGRGGRELNPVNRPNAALRRLPIAGSMICYEPRHVDRQI